MAGNGKYDAAQVAKELDETALGLAFHGNALRVAKDWPGATADDRALLDRYATGRNTAMDHVALQDLAVRLREPAPSPQPPAEAPITDERGRPMTYWGGKVQPPADEPLTYRGIPIGPTQTFADIERQAAAFTQAQGGGEVAMEAWNAALNDAGDLRTNAPDERYERRAQNVEAWIKANRPTPPSAPVGVEVLARLEAAERANEALRIDVAEAHDARRQAQAKNRELEAALAQQPAADGGFTAADMMDARQEGRHLGQQLAAMGVEVKVLARDVHYAIRDAGLAPGSPADDAAMRDAILRALAQPGGSDND